jgi:membrane-associated phospholipid phosphatase
MSRISTTESQKADRSVRIAERWPLDRRSLLEVAGIYLVLSTVGIALGALAVSWSESSSGRGIDGTLVGWWQAQRSATLDTLTNVGSSFGDTAILSSLVVSLFLALVFVWRRRRGAAALGLALGFEVTVFLTVSSVVGRARPQVEQLDPSPPTASFPSGHVGASVAFVVIVVVIVFWNSRIAGWRVLAATTALAISVIVALSRMYRGMHFLTDVAGGALLGAAAAGGAWIVVHRALDRKVKEELST